MTAKCCAVSSHGDASKEEQGNKMPVTVVSGPKQHDLALVLTSEVAAPYHIEASAATLTESTGHCCKKQHNCGRFPHVGRFCSVDEDVRCA
jgi:hypothetical protein